MLTCRPYRTNDRAEVDVNGLKDSSSSQSIYLWCTTFSYSTGLSRVGEAYCYLHLMYLMYFPPKKQFVLTLSHCHKSKRKIMWSIIFKNCGFLFGKQCMVSHSAETLLLPDWEKFSQRTVINVRLNPMRSCQQQVSRSEKNLQLIIMAIDWAHPVKDEGGTCTIEMILKSTVLNSTRNAHKSGELSNNC